MVSFYLWEDLTTDGPQSSGGENPYGPLIYQVKRERSQLGLSSDSATGNATMLIQRSLDDTDHGTNSLWPNSTILSLPVALTSDQFASRKPCILRIHFFESLDRSMQCN
jgi:hypothetical protein